MSQNTVAPSGMRGRCSKWRLSEKGLEVEEELRAVVHAIEGDADIQKFISTPNIPQSVKMNVISQALAGKVSPCIEHDRIASRQRAYRNVR